MSNHLALLESNDDLLGPNCDVEVVRFFLQGMESAEAFQNVSSTMLQTLISRANICLNSSTKLNGLLIVRSLASQCNSEVIEGYAYSWVQSCVSKVLSGGKSSSLDEKILACQILQSIFYSAPKFPDASKHISSFSVTILHSLLDNFQCGEVVVKCLRQLLLSYPGAFGQSDKIRIKIFAAFGNVKSKSLAECASLLPRLGGSGKDGILHKESWTLYFKRFIKTYFDIQSEIFSTLMGNPEKGEFLKGVDPFDEFLWKGSSQDLLFNMLEQIKRLEYLEKIISAFLKSPFPYAKIFSPKLFLCLSEQLFDNISYNDDNISQEGLIARCVYPDLISNILRILISLISVCQRDIIRHVSQFVGFSLRVLNCPKEDAFFNSKLLAMKLVRLILHEFKAASGIHSHCDEFISITLRNIVPPKEKEVSTENKPVSSNGKRKKSKSKRSSMNNRKGCSPRSKEWDGKLSMLISESISLISDMFLHIGTLIRPSLHKDVQCVILRLTLDVLQQSNVQKSIFRCGELRTKIYDLVRTLVLNPHPSFCSPLRYAVIILSRGLQDPDPMVAESARIGLATCESIIHPRSPYLSSDEILSESAINKVMSEIVKVHECQILVRKNSGFSVDDSTKSQEDIQEIVSNLNNIKETAKIEDDAESTNDSMETEESPVAPFIPDQSKKIDQMDAMIIKSRSNISDEELIKTLYKQDKSPIHVPEETKEIFFEKERKEIGNFQVAPSKKIKLSDMDSEQELDLNDMLSSFVTKKEALSDLKKNFQNNYVG